nr:unnamed protein product [Callosobruchus chinensis]
MKTISYIQPRNQLNELIMQGNSNNDKHEHRDGQRHERFDREERRQILGGLDPVEIMICVLCLLDSAVDQGVCLAGLSEGMQLAERFGLNSSFLQTVFESSQLSSNYLKDKMAKIIDRQVASSDQRLEDLQTDLKLVLDLSNELDETDQVRDSLETCAISHQLLKHCCKLDYGSFDPAAIHLRNKD